MDVDEEATEERAFVGGARLVALGAAVHTVHEGLTVMTDPEGNEFCVE